jgi:hypothetical protein
MDGLDDLGVVDALEMDRRDVEVGVTELALDHDQWHPFACHLYRVGMPELVRREAPVNATPPRPFTTNATVIAAWSCALA